jgi:hypothetical protein
VRKLSDPDAERHINLRDARRLDTAFQREGGEGAPLHECYALQLELSTGVRSFCSAEMLNAVGSVARETGEAVSAALTAIEQGTPKARRDAIREVEEGIASLTSMLGKLGAAEAFGGEENEPNSRG